MAKRVLKAKILKIFFSLFGQNLSATLKALLIYLLILQQVFSPSIVLAVQQDSQPPPSAEADNPIGQFEPNTELATILADGLKSPDAKEHSAQLLDVADQIETGNFQLDPEKLDIHKFKGQYLKYYKNGVFSHAIDLNQPDRVIPSTVFANEDIRYSYNPEKREFIIQSVRGMRANSEGGEIQVEHVIPNIDLLAFKDGRESRITYLLDTKGSLFAIHHSLIKAAAFNMEVPVVKLWQVTDSNHPLLTAQSIKMDVFTAGVDLSPYTDLENAEVAPRNEEGKVVIAPKDLLIRYMDAAGASRDLGVFSYDDTKDILDFSSLLLLQQMILLSPSDKAMMLSEQVSREIEVLKQKFQNRSKEIQNSPENEVIRSFVLKIKPEDLARYISLEKVQDGNNKHLIEEWKQIFTDIQSKYRQTNALTETEPLSAPRIEELQNKWYEHVEQSQRVNPFHKNTSREDPVEVLEKTIKTENRTFKKVVWTVVGLTASYLTFPAAYDQFDPTRQVLFLNWIYENLYPISLRTASYNSLVLKHIGQFMFITITPFIGSWIFEKIVRTRYIKYKNSDLPEAAAARDMYNKWIPMTHWQRFSTLMVRMHATIFYPYIRRIVQSGFRQKDFTTALDAGLNPFSFVSKNSPLQKTAELNGKSSFVGVNNPLEFGEKKSLARQRLQLALKDQKARATALAWVLATIAVSEKEGVDLTTLQRKAEDGLDIEGVKKINSDERQTKEWILLSQKIYSEIQRSSESVRHDIQNIDPNELGRFYSYARDNALMLKQSKGYELERIQLTKKSIATANDLMLSFLNSGYREWQHSRHTNIDRFSAGEGHKEMWADLPSTIIVTAIIGPRADPSNSGELAAIKGVVLNSNPEQTHELAMNYAYHWFQNLTRMNYLLRTRINMPEDPKFESPDKYRYRPNERGQSFTSAAKDWARGMVPWNGLTKKTKHLENPELYEYSSAGFIHRFHTVQALATVGIASRVLIAGLPLGEALASFSYSFFATQICYNVILDFLQVGNSLEEGRIREMNAQFENSKKLILDGIREGNAEKSQELLKQGYGEMMELYQDHNKKALGTLNDYIVNPKYQGQPSDGSNDPKLQKYQEMMGQLQTLVQTRDPKLKEYYGLIAKLFMALKQNDESAIESIRVPLESALRLEVPDLELQKLNAQGLLDFAMTNPPVYFKNSYYFNRRVYESPNEVFPWIIVGATMPIAAYIYTQIAINMFETDKITPENIAYWAMVNIAGYAVLKATFSRSAWEFYFERVEKIKVLMAKTKARFKTEVKSKLDINARESEGRSNTTVNSCQNLFVK